MREACENFKTCILCFFGTVWVRKLCFGALESRFGVKKAKFCELRAKLGHLRPIKAEELT